MDCVEEGTSKSEGIIKVKAIAYVYIHPATAKVKTEIREISPNPEADDASLLETYAPSELRLGNSARGGWQFCNWHVVEVAA